MGAIKYRLMLALAYLGAVIGAGFASGQEIVQFFVNYGNQGMKGVIMAGCLFALSGGLLMSVAQSYGTSSYQQLLVHLFGDKLSKIIDLLLALFLYLGTSTMLSAAGAIFCEHLYLPKNLGILLSYFIVLMFLVTGKKGLVVSYNLLVPVKVALLLAITAYIAFIFRHPAPVASLQLLPAPGPGSWALAGLLYVAYNFSLAMVVLVEYQSFTGGSHAVQGAMLGGGILGLLLIVYYLALVKFQPVISRYEVPMLYVTGYISPLVKYIYTLVLWIGILTTALANTYGFSQRIAKLMKVNYKICLIVGMTLALPLATQSFSGMVGKIYPIFGVLGIFILIALIEKSVKALGLELYYYIIQIIAKLRGAWND